MEGCLFGNGERTGNVDLVTLALNLHTQGVDPMIDFSELGTVRRTVEDCIRLPVHPRHPYAGDLVHTAFSGTHQDAISKGLAHHARRAADLGVPESEAPWTVPYLPVDPADVGCTYEAVIRVNSQSGKGGIAHLLQLHHGLDLPQDMRPDFSRTVQRATDDSGQEATPKDLWELFRSTYLAPGEEGPLTLDSWSTSEPAPGEHRVRCDLGGGGTADGRGRHEGAGNGPLAAFADALGRRREPCRHPRLYRPRPRPGPGQRRRRLRTVPHRRRHLLGRGPGHLRPDGLGAGGAVGREPREAGGPLGPVSLVLRCRRRTATGTGTSA